MNDRNGKELRYGDVCVIHELRTPNREDEYLQKGLKVGDIVEFRLESVDYVSAYCLRDGDRIFCYFSPDALEIIGSVR